MKIWLDDERDPNNPVVIENFPIAKDGPWVWYKTVESCEDVVKSGQVEHISFDNDLGEGIKEGRHLANFIEELAFTGEIPRITWDVHSKNSVAGPLISQAMSNADRFWDSSEKEILASLLSHIVKNAIKDSVAKEKPKKYPFILYYKFPGGEKIPFRGIGSTILTIDAYTNQQAFAMFYHKYKSRVSILLERGDVWVEPDTRKIEKRKTTKEEQNRYETKVIDNCWWNDEANTDL